MRGLVGKRVVTALAVVVAASAWATSALAAPAPCADVMPLEDVSVGMKGTGYTVAQGTDPETFDVEVLGIARGPFLPGRDVINLMICGQ